MVESLGTLLRATLSNKKPLVALDYEIGLAGSYMTIQKIRFEDRLLFHVECPKELGKALILPLTIQPLLENAIRYGMEEMMDTCEISTLGEITLASDGDHLTGLWFDGQKYFAATLSAEHQERELPIFELTKEWSTIYASISVDLVLAVSLRDSSYWAFAFASTTAYTFITNYVCHSMYPPLRNIKQCLCNCHYAYSNINWMNIQAILCSKLETI